MTEDDGTGREDDRSEQSTNGDERSSGESPDEDVPADDEPSDEPAPADEDDRTEPTDGSARSGSATEETPSEPVDGAGDSSPDPTTAETAATPEDAAATADTATAEASDGTPAVDEPGEPSERGEPTEPVDADEPSESLETDDRPGPSGVGEPAEPPDSREADRTGVVDAETPPASRPHGGDWRDSPAAERSPAIDQWSVRSIVRTLVPLLALMSVLQMGSGTVLEAFEEQLLTQPSLLILVPVMIGTAGNLGSIMSARLTTQFHLGTLELTPSNPNFRANVLAVFGLAATVFTLLGIAAWGIGRALGGSLGLGPLLIVSLVSGMLLAAWVVVVTAVSVAASYRLGFDPDDTTIPVVTNVCDITGVLILFGVVSIVL